MLTTRAAAAPFSAVAIVLLSIPGVSHAQAGSGDTVRLDLAEARRIGLASRPEVAAARGRLSAAMGERRLAGAYAYNPQVQVKASSAIDPGDWGPIEALFTQELEWAGQWGARKAGAEAGVAMARAGAADVMRMSTLEIDVAFFRAAAAQQALDVRTSGLDMSRRFSVAIQTELREGKISLLDANLAQIEAGRAQAAERSARRAALVAIVELRRTLGLSDDRVIRVALDDDMGVDPRTMSLDSLVTAAISARPDLHAADAGVQRSEANRRLASRSVLPNLRLSAVAVRGSSAGPLNWGLQFGLPVPLWNRGGGLRDRARGEEETARADREATEMRVRSDVATALEAYRAAWEGLELLDSQVLRPARANQRLLETAYEAGRLNLPTALLLRTQLLAAEIEYWDTWLAARAARAGLQAAVGDVTMDARSR